LILSDDQRVLAIESKLTEHLAGGQLPGKNDSSIGEQTYVGLAAKP
jgi:hypothetical protein